MTPASEMCCPACGQVMPPEIEFSPTKQRIWKAILERPRTPEQVRYAVWGSDTCDRALRQHLYQMNKDLIPHGVRIQNRPLGPYKLISLEVTRS